MYLPLLLLFLFAACHPRLPMQLDSTDPTALLNAISQESDKRRQVAGRFEIRGVRLKRLFGHLDADIIAQTPSKLYVAIRSFFEAPAQIVATDGTNLFFWDAVQYDPPYMYKGRIQSNRTLLEVIPLPPADIVHLLLGIPPTNEMQLQDVVLQNQDTVAVTSVGKDKRQIRVVYRLSDLRLLRVTTKDGNGRQLYDVRYSNFKELNEVDFAHTLDVEFQRGATRDRLQIKAKEIQLNGPAYSDDTFFPSQS